MIIFLADTAYVGFGIVYIYEDTIQLSTFFLRTLNANVDTLYVLACLTLNVTLMSMVVTRLARHNRTMRRALGPSTPAGGSYRTISTILIESFSLYTVCLLFSSVMWAYGSTDYLLISAILTAAQVCTVFRLP